MNSYVIYIGDSVLPVSYLSQYRHVATASEIWQARVEHFLKVIHCMEFGLLDQNLDAKSDRQDVTHFGWEGRNQVDCGRLELECKIRKGASLYNGLMKVSLLILRN